MEAKTKNVGTSICIDCKKSGGLCSWTKSLNPVEGWTAKKVNRVSATFPHKAGYRVIKCPLFEREERDKKCTNCKYLVLCPLEKQAFYKNSKMQCEEYTENDK